MNQDRPVRWGISSPGRIAAKFVTGLQLLDDAEVVGVGSRSLERAQTFASEHGIERAHGSLASLLADPEVDVIYVASTANAHHHDVLQCLDAGKPVLCEKPFAVNEQQASEMVERARERGVFLMEALWSRFQPGYRLLRRLLDEGAIGEVRHIDAQFGFNLPAEQRVGHRLLDPARLGGALVDLGIYPIHLCHFVFGEPSSVQAAAVIGPTGVDLQTSIALGWPRATASLFCAIDAAGTNSARIVGTGGVIELDAFMHVPPRLHVTAGGSTITHECAVVPPGLQYQATEVHNCLRRGALESTVMPHSETLAMMSTLDRVRGCIDLSFPDE